MPCNFCYLPASWGRALMRSPVPNTSPRNSTVVNPFGGYRQDLATGYGGWMRSCLITTILALGFLKEADHPSLHVCVVVNFERRYEVLPCGNPESTWHLSAANGESTAICMHLSAHRTMSGSKIPDLSPIDARSDPKEHGIVSTRPEEPN